MSYSELDDTLRKWAAENQLVMQTEFAGQDRRFLYLSSSSGETYQISVDEPEGGAVRIHVSAVETADDMEAHLEWFVPIHQLSAALDTAKKTISECLWRREPLKCE